MGFVTSEPSLTATVGGGPCPVRAACRGRGRPRARARRAGRRARAASRPRSAASEPLASRIALTARRAASLAALHRRQVGVASARSRRPGRGSRPRAGRRSGRCAQEPVVLTSSGSRFVASVGFGYDDVGVEEPVGAIGVASTVAVVERGLELGPDLVGDLVAWCSRGDLALGRVRPGSPSRRCPPRGCRRRCPSPMSCGLKSRPELPLGDRRQRPRRVDVDAVAVHERHVARRGRT